MYNVLFAGAHTLHCSSWAQLSAPYASRCYSCASLVCYSCANLMAEPCADCHVALPPPHSTIFSGFLRSVAFLPQAFRSQSIGFRRSRRTPSPTLLCAGAMHSGQLLSVGIAHRFTLGTLHLYKCWIALCWCTKHPSKDNLPLPLLARKRDNRQSDGETIDKAAVR